MILRGCDICGTFDNVVHYQVRSGDSDVAKRLDLCPDCRQSLFTDIDSRMSKAAREFYKKQIS